MIISVVKKTPKIGAVFPRGRDVFDMPAWMFRGVLPEWLGLAGELLTCGVRV